jgi:hypothetical protein
MATSKAKKEHRKKVEKRNQRIREEKSKMEKMKREFIMNLIKQEQEKGLFDNTQNANEVINVPVIDGSVIDGPTIS